MHYRRVHDRVFYDIVFSSELFRAQNMYIKQIAVHEGASQSELADIMALRPATVTNALQRLEKSGFVERRSDPADARKSRVYLTEKGRKVVKQIDGDVESVINACFRLPQPEAEQFIATLQKLEQSMREYRQEGREAE